MDQRASAPLAAALSFVLPGLGHLALGRRRRAVAFAAPALLFTAGVVWAIAARGVDLLELLVRPDVLLLLVALDLGILAYRLVAIVDAWRIARHRGGGRTRSSLALLGLLVAISVASQGAFAVVGVQASRTLDSVFLPGDDWAIPPPEPTPTPVPTPVRSPSPTPGPSATPRPTRPPTPVPSPPPEWVSEGRLNLLLVGADAGPGRWGLRTDTMIVLSVDVPTGRAALFGIPRNMVGVPLPAESASAVPGGRFPDLLNALYVYAMDRPHRFPGDDARGFRAVAGAIQELVGVRIHGMIGVNLNGFVRLVDAVGGLWIDVPERLVDWRYPLEDGRRFIRIDIRPGCQQLDGRMALAYARSRNQDSDYGRMGRQQQVLLALRRQLEPLELLPRLPELLDIARDDLWTTIPRDEVGELARLASRVEPSGMATVMFVPPAYPSHVDDRAIATIRATARSVFDEPPGAPSPAAGSPSATPAPACP